MRRARLDAEVVENDSSGLLSFLVTDVRISIATAVSEPTRTRHERMLAIVHAKRFVISSSWCFARAQSYSYALCSSEVVIVATRG